MKRWFVVIFVIAVSSGVLYYAQRHKTETHVGPEAVLNALADTEREISRVPSNLVRLSDPEEVRVGNAMAQSYLVGRGPLQPADAEMEEYVGLVGQTMASRGRRNFLYKFHYIPNATLVNAFALPGGHVFIGQGLVKLLRSEDELASVLGHEVEHVENYHCNDRVALQARLRHIPLGGLVALPVELFQAGYSKEQEMEADRDGVALAVEAGYSPQGAIDLFDTFARMEPANASHTYSPDQEFSKVALDGIAGYFRSHPLPRERVAQVHRLMESQRWPQPPQRELRVRVAEAVANQ